LRAGPYIGKLWMTEFRIKYRMKINESQKAMKDLIKF